MIAAVRSAFVFLGLAIVLAAHAQAPARAAKPLVIGETFSMVSEVLGEERRINVYLPPAYTAPDAAPLPVLYMLDGGVLEDFIHVAGLVQVLTGNGTMRPFVLVGIENTERRRDLTGPTENEKDKTIAPRVGRSAEFRAFLRKEVIPQIEKRYRVTRERAIEGESLAGLFVVETLLLEPDLFDTYIAFDPSLWWNNETLVKNAATRLRASSRLQKTVYLASSSEKDLARLTRQLADVFRDSAPPGVKWQYQAMPDETHATIYHPAALEAFRRLFKPPAGAGAGF